MPNKADNYDLYPPRIKISMDINELSPYIYDKKTRKAKNMSDFLWTGLCLAINAKNIKSLDDSNRIVINSNHSITDGGNKGYDFDLDIFVGDKHEN